MMLQYAIPYRKLGRGTILEALGRKLKELREERGLTQREAARLLGISNTRLSEYELGYTRTTGRPATPNRELLAKMAALYGFPLDVLLGLARLPLAEPSPAPLPTPDEAAARELGEIYRILDDGQRRVLMVVARALRAETLANRTRED